MISWTYLVAGAMALALTAHGQEATYDEDNDSIYDAFMLDQVVVTSSKSEVKRRNSPALVNVMPSTLLTTVGACSLADGLSFQPGVRHGSFI